MKRWLVWGALLMVSSCGVPVESEARSISSDRVPPGLRPSATDGELQSVEDERVVLWFVREGHLVPVTRRLPAPIDAMHVLDGLQAGPTEGQQGAGLRSALPGLGLIAGATVSGGTAVVELSDGFAQIPAADQVLAVGQIVLTLTDRPGVGRVAFRVEGVDVAVPLPVGDSSPSSVSREDFLSLASPQL